MLAGERSLPDGNSDRTGNRSVDRKEVTVIGDEVAVGRLIRVGPNHRGVEARGVVRIERVPFRVDVELHCPHRSDVLKDLGDADHCLIIRGNVNEVASSIDPNASAPNLSSAAERVSPLRAVRIRVQRGIQLTVPDDRSQALSGPCDARAWVRSPAPIHDVDATIRISNERHVAVLQRLVRLAVIG